MPVIYDGKLMMELQMQLTKMSLPELARYERFLWQWMHNSPPSIVAVLNAIYREVEWRAQDTAFR